MVDRNARDEMARAIRVYMDEQITAFQFDDKLNDIIERTEDQTVQDTGQALWFCYDDCKDHPVVADKVSWDYFNRLLLLLESDVELEIVRGQREWHWLQLAAAVLLVTFAGIAWQVGFDRGLFLCALPFGPPSMLIHWLKRRRKRTEFPTEIALIPFPSVASLLSIRRRVKTFTRKPCPLSLAKRPIRTPEVEMIMLIPTVIFWSLFSPVVLFAQMLPGHRLKTSVKKNHAQTAA